MKKYCKIILSYIASIINLFYNNKIQNILNKIHVYIYSFWIRKQFKEIGEDTYFYKKLTLVGAQYIHIKEKTTFGYGCILTAWESYGSQRFSPSIQIGINSHIGEYNHITAINSISIGNGVLTGRWVTITDNAHGKSTYEELCLIPHQRKLYSKGSVIIEDNVWIGDKVTILPNVRIGESCIIAANSVVTKDIPAFSIAAGIPATIIKTIQHIS